MIVNGKRGAIRAAVVLAALPWACPVVRAQDAYIQTMRFAADMAKRGNWREAKYRWDKAELLEPGNPRVLNNQAVALEAMGDSEGARKLYIRAVTLAHGETVIDTNLLRSERFWSQVRETGDSEVPTYDVRGVIPGDPEGHGQKKKKGKTFKAVVQLPVPARLDLGDRKTMLVASFLTEESHLLDINRELVRFIRSEYRKDSKLDVLSIVPAPAVPEQRLSDLIANREFWKYLGGEYGADLIVSGVMLYDRRDSSGFQDVDVVSSTTGQKVRQSQFVEQERFLYELDIIFMDGATGELLFRDRLQRSSMFRGTQNDPITAFFDLSESIAADVLAIVEPRMREDIRFVFKK